MRGTTPKRGVRERTTTPRSVTARPFLLVLIACIWFALFEKGFVESFGMPLVSQRYEQNTVVVPGIYTTIGTPTTRQQSRKKSGRPTITRTTTTTTSLSGLVAADDSWGNLATLATVSVAAQSLGNSTRVGRLLGAPVTAMALTFGLASIGVLVPGGTDTSRNLQKLAIQFATPWILLGADFGGNKNPEKNNHRLSTVPLVLGFGLATLATLVGGTVGFWCAGPSLVASSLGAHNGLAIASALLAKNIGSGINYVAVCAALEASPEAMAAGLCIDNIGALVYFPISNLLASRYPDDVVVTTEEEEEHATATAPNDNNHSITVPSLSIAIFAATVLLWCGDFVANNLLASPSSQIPVVTLLSVILAGIVAPRLKTKLPSVVDSLLGLRKTCDVLGTVALYLFFTTAGAPGIRVAESMKSALIPLSVFSVLLYAVHGGILAAVYQLGSATSRFRTKWRKRTPRGAKVAATTTKTTTTKWKWRDIASPQRLLVASSSAIGGPPTSVALAQSMGWNSLVVQALLVGNIGYAISTFLGIAFYYAIQPLVLGG